MTTKDCVHADLEENALKYTVYMFKKETKTGKY
jgi:hypothetical protein